MNDQVSFSSPAYHDTAAPKRSISRILDPSKKDPDGAAEPSARRPSQVPQTEGKLRAGEHSLPLSPVPRARSSPIWISRRRGEFSSLLHRFHAYLQSSFALYPLPSPSYSRDGEGSDREASDLEHFVSDSDEDSSEE